VVPVFANSDEVSKDALNKSDFATLWYVIRALRAHDEVLSEELDALRTHLGKRVPRTAGRNLLPDKLMLDLPADMPVNFANEIYASTIEKITTLPKLTEEQIISWAKEWFEKYGKWPTANSGEIEGTNGENWTALNSATSAALRGFPRKISLANLLQEHGLKKNKANQGALTEEQIVGWMDRHFVATGKWPTQRSGKVLGAKHDKWLDIDNALASGSRGLPGNSSIATLREKYRKVRNTASVPDLTEEKILEWADEYYVIHEEYPQKTPTEIPDSGGETWGGVDVALRNGRRGLQRKITLAQLLHESGKKKNPFGSEDLSEEQVLEWADKHYQVHKKYPTARSGIIEDTLETWSAVSGALYQGTRGLSKGESINQFLHRHGRDVEIAQKLPPLTEEQILIWVDEYFEIHEKYPSSKSSEEIPNANGQTWRAVNSALTEEGRGLQRKSSLFQLIAENRPAARAALTEELILKWVDEYYETHEEYPSKDSGKIQNSGHRTWLSIFNYLRDRQSGKTTLAKFIASNRHVAGRSPLSEELILEWVDEYYETHEKYPSNDSGEIPGARGEKWSMVNSALNNQSRELPRRIILANFISEHRPHMRPKRPYRARMRYLSEEQILAWVDEYCATNGKYHAAKSGGDIPNSNGETWSTVNTALRSGPRWLSGQTTLAKFIAENRPPLDVPPAKPHLTEEQILVWVDYYYELHGKYPSRNLNSREKIPNSNSDTWSGIDTALRTNGRGLRRKTTLAKLIAEHKEKHKETNRTPDTSD